jgi:hypothetical protein
MEQHDAHFAIFSYKDDEFEENKFSFPHQHYLR